MSLRGKAGWLVLVVVVGVASGWVSYNLGRDGSLWGGGRKVDRLSPSAMYSPEAQPLAEGAVAKDAAIRPAGEKFGRVLFETSCSAAAQLQFERAVAMLHSFLYPATIDAFNAVLKIDPTCAIAYWGIAASQRPNPFVGPWSAETMQRGFDAVKAGQALGAKTQRERDWLAAIGEVYKDFEKVDQETRMLNHSKAMAELVAKYPQDVEARIFYALALNEAAPHDDNLLLNQRKAADILEPLFKAQPDHPGIAHYLIHSVDYPQLAKRGLAAAEMYGKIAPSAPHALHMPSHIYAMLGMWPELIASNLRALDACRAESARNYPGFVCPAAMHSYDFIQYGYIQLGMEREARALIEEVGAIRKERLVRGGSVTGMASVPARYALELQDWNAAAQLTPLGLESPAAEGITYFARSLGAARTGKLEAARADLAVLRRIFAVLEKLQETYWIEQVEVQILAVEAWIAHSEGARSEAHRLLQKAAVLQDSRERHAMELHVYPFREMLGEMMMMDGRPAESLAECEASLRLNPERLRGYYCAARAAAATGDNAKSTAYFNKLLQLTRNGNSERTEVREAMQFLARK